MLSKKTTAEGAWRGLVIAYIFIVYLRTFISIVKKIIPTKNYNSEFENRFIYPIENEITT